MIQLLPSIGQIQFEPGLSADPTLGFGLFLLQLLLESFDAGARWSWITAEARLTVG